MKRLIQKILKNFGVKIVHANRYDVLRFEDKSMSPFSIPYYANTQPALINLDICKGRSNRWFDLSPDSADPHYHALRSAISKNLFKDEFVAHVVKILEINRDMSVARNAAEQFGLHDIDTKLLGYPYWAEVLPWHNRTIDQVVDLMPEEVKKNRERHGFKIASNNPDEIMRLDRLNSVSSHAKQYEKLYTSVIKHGVNDTGDYGFISVEILSKASEFCWKPGLDGNHRIMLYAAMGIEKVPAVIERIIRYEDIHLWPNVANGTFTEREAMLIFDSIFDASPPRFYDEWIEYYDKTR